jgi:cold shock CspA family protein
LPEEDYGLIESEKGHEIDFHRISVAGERFDSLAVGDEIHHIQENDDLGPQASIVYP